MLLVHATLAAPPPAGGSPLTPNATLPTPHHSAFNNYEPAHARRIEALTGERLHTRRTTECAAATSSELALPPRASGTRTRGKRRASVYFQHLHKAGGTMMCELAQRNGEKMMDTAQIQENCSPKGDGIWLERNEIGPGYSRACADRMRLAAMTSFMAVERWADRDMCADDLDYAVVVRDPIDRIVSNTIFTQSSAAGGPGCIEEAYPYEKCTGDAIVGWVAPGAEVSLHAPEALRRCDLIERSTAGYDNFYVRSLVGPDAFTLPAGSITREHLTKAKKRLAKYAAIIVLDSFDEQSAQLAHILGWRTLDLGDVANSKQSHGLGSAPPPFTDAQLAQLAEANALDYDLYCFAKQLAEERTRVAVLAKATSAGTQYDARIMASSRDHKVS